MSVKAGVAQIVGRTISHVVVKESLRIPRSQVFLVFTDGTYYEFYSEGFINGASGVDTGGIEEVRRYMPANTIVLDTARGEGPL